MKKKPTRFNLGLLPDFDDTIRVYEALAKELGRPPAFEELKNSMKKVLVGKIFGVDMGIGGDKLDSSVGVVV